VSPSAWLTTASASPWRTCRKCSSYSLRFVCTRDDPKGGLGIGLALVRKLVEMHQGTVCAQSEGTGTGSTRSLRPDLVFMDIGMPQMDGNEAAVHLRSYADGAPMVLVALTGWGQAHDQQRTREAGFDRHLLKPIDPVELNEILKASPC
jgi:CheY-like chemotaxis protein